MADLVTLDARGVVPLSLTGEASASGIEKTGRFVSVEVGRGVAACLVAAYHASNMIVWSGMSAVRPFGGLMGDFNAGVDFFFVLSGFLVSWVHWSDIGRAERLPRYASRRFTRVYPTYWVVLLPLIAAELLAGRHTNLYRIVASVLLLPDTQGPILGVAWSLVYEIFFYFVFGLLIRFGRPMLLAFPVWAGAILYCSIRGGTPVFPGNFFFNAYNIEFLIGVAAAASMKRFQIPYALPMCLVGVTAFASMMVFHIGNSLDLGALGICTIYGLAAAMIICGLVQLERRGQISLPPWIGILGGASYAIYLVHPIVYSSGLHVVRSYVSHFSPGLFSILFALAGILMGILFHLLLERHITFWSRNLLSAWMPVRTGTGLAPEKKPA